MAVARTSSSQCAWCPFSCPSPETAACRTYAELTPEVLRGITRISQAPSSGVCEPSWRDSRPARRTVDVIRDIADYREASA